MGRLVLISGENGSGKSAFAESAAAGCAGGRYYIAAMLPQSEDDRARIARHRRQRRGLGFRTLELPYRIGGARVDSGGTVLLEDVSNLLANVMFGRGGTEKDVFDDIRELLGRCRLLLAVTIAGLSPQGYEPQTAAYINALARLNAMLADIADAAVTMRGGEPFFTKGGPDDIY